MRRNGIENGNFPIRLDEGSDVCGLEGVGKSTTKRPPPVSPAGGQQVRQITKEQIANYAKILSSNKDLYAKQFSSIITLFLIK